MYDITVIEACVRYAATCAAYHAALGIASALALSALYCLTLSLTASSWRDALGMMSRSQRAWYWLALASLGLGMLGHAYADWHLWGMEWWRW